MMNFSGHQHARCKISDVSKENRKNHMTVSRISIPKYKTISVVMIPTSNVVDLQSIVSLVRAQNMRYMTIINYDDNINTPEDVLYNTSIYPHLISIIDIEGM